MVAIKDMKMPKSCDGCPINVDDEYCGITGNFIYSKDFVRRNKDCPLIEIKENEE